MTNNVNFDELAGNAFAPNAGESDFENLFAAVFSLPEWYFIADAEFQYKMPYCMPFKSLGDEITLTVFTDGARATKFIAEQGIKFGATDENPNAPNKPEDLVMRISTDGILDFFDRLAPFKITKIFFNPNIDSHGFHHDLKMMRPIHDHLKNKGLLEKPSAENASGNLDKLIEENADVIADFERENEVFSSMIAGSASAMDGVSDESGEQIISNTAEMFESVRVQQNMPPKLFRAYIETCLEKRKFLMPTLAFAYFQQSESGIKKLQDDAELADEMAKFLIKKVIPNADLPMDETPQKRVEPVDEKPAESRFDFDALSRKAIETNAMEDLNALFGAVFALEKWNFIARGELPDIYPYVASNPATADNQPMIRVFTDEERLMRFARENNLTEADGSAKILTLPTDTIIPYLEGFIEHGTYGVWFNSDSGSADFFIPIKQLQPIKDHLAKLNPPVEKIAETGYTTLILTITDGLMFPSGTVSKSTYNCNFFCWIPRSWTENLQIKDEYLEKLYEQFYGADWRSGNSDGSRYVVLEANSSVISPERIQGTDWSVVQNNELNKYWFYIGEGNGAFKNVAVDEFKTYIDAYLQTQNRAEAQSKQDNLANFGVSETPDGGFDLNLTVNKVGTVDFDTSIAPFYEAIVPLLQDFQGTGEYLTLLRFEESGKNDQVENIVSNSHGAYLQIRRFLYLNPNNGVRIGVNTIHSNHLRHVQTQSELKVSFELCKNLDNQTGVFYHAFQGAREDVLKLEAAIQPLLESVNYRSAS
ncbi:MAG: hypothetical protein LUM44_18245 [Pyrinomonadaceae bacterium]|nr:hypothetical protein [Pyrinomonadaceae bacterium]